MPTNALAEISPPPDCSQAGQLARKWAVTFAELFCVSLVDRGPRFVGLWALALSDLKPDVLESACQRAMQSCKFFPTPAEIRAHIGRAEENATTEAAEQAWQRVLDLRRRFWNPDMPSGFSRGMPTLSPRIDRAARAAGVFRDHETVEALHVWAKKKFIESFTRWDEVGEAQNLLPDGEMKRLLTDAAQSKALPAPTVSFADLHERGLEYAAKTKLLSAWKGAAAALPEVGAEARQQIDAELSGYGARFAAALKRRQEAAAGGVT